MPCREVLASFTWGRESKRDNYFTNSSASCGAGPSSCQDFEACSLLSNSKVNVSLSVKDSMIRDLSGVLSGTTSNVVPSAKLTIEDVLQSPAHQVSQ